MNLHNKTSRLKTSQHLKPLLVLYMIWGTYLCILWPKMLYLNEKSELVAGWRNIWGDWAYHISQVQALATEPFGYAFFHHPLYPGIPISYPFIINLFSAFLLKFGLPLVTAMLTPAWFFSLVMLACLYYLGITLTNNRWGTVLAISFFLTSGGLGFYRYIQDILNHDPFSWEFVFYPPHEYTHMKDDGYWWTTTFLAHLVPQRAFILGITWGSLMLARLYRLLFIKKEKTYKAWYFLGLGIGLLAFLHTHSLLVFLFLLTWFGLLNIKFLRQFIVLGLGLFLTAIPFFLFFTETNSLESIRFLPGWLASPTETKLSFFFFWWINWGLMIPVALIGFLMFIKKLYLSYKKSFKFNTSLSGQELTKSQRTLIPWKFNSLSEEEFQLRSKFLTYPSVRGFLQLSLAWFLLFGIGSLFIFQPSTWDNAKIFIWVYLGFSILAADWLSKISSKSLFHAGWAASVSLLIMASGGIDLIRVLNTSKESFVMINQEGIELAEKLKTIVPEHGVVATSDDHLHWVPVMAGRPIMLGYRGWLWSHGIDYASREGELRQLYSGGMDAREVLNKYNIQAIVVNQKTKDDYGWNPQFFSENFDLAIQSENYQVYVPKK